MGDLLLSNDEFYKSWELRPRSVDQMDLCLAKMAD